MSSVDVDRAAVRVPRRRTYTRHLQNDFRPDHKCIKLPRGMCFLSRRPYTVRAEYIPGKRRCLLAAVSVLGGLVNGFENTQSHDFKPRFTSPYVVRIWK